MRHPNDDPNPEYFGEHKIPVTDSVDDICDMIKPRTRTVVIAGATHFESKDIVILVDALVRSNRNVLISALNLDSEGKPHQKMPDFMALADEVIMAKASCAQYDCVNPRSANRSVRIHDGRYFPVCAYHHPTGKASGGYFEIDVGGMFSGKTGELIDKIRLAQHEDVPYAFFKSAIDVRYGQAGGKETFDLHRATRHNEEGLHAIVVANAQDIQDYLQSHSKVKTAFITELQFIPGIYDVIFNLISRGYTVYGDGLPRGFNRQPFNDVPPLMCLADKVNMHYAICVKCGDPATESQRMKLVDGKGEPVHHGEDLIAPGGSEDGAKKSAVEYFYQARCMNCWELPGEPALRYQLEKFRWE